MTKRASYRDGIEWIAWNDEPSLREADEIADSISVALLAHLFGKTPFAVAAAVARCRIKNGI